MNTIEGQIRIPSGCAIAAVISREGHLMTGEAIIESMKPMHDRSNGLGGGFAAYGIYPEYRDFFALHMFLDDRAARKNCEAFLRETMETRVFLGRKPERMRREPDGRLNCDLPPQLQLSMPVLFSTMSYGSISYNAHACLARAAQKLGIRSSADVVKAIALGADACYIGTAALLALGCHLCRSCQTGLCNWGITTQRPELVKRLDIDEGSRRLVDLMTAWRHEIKEMMGGMGINSVEALRGNRLMLRGVGLTDRELHILGISHAGE